MNPTLQLNLSQQLKLSPQLQQSIKLLQLSHLALQQEIQYQLETNPLLNLVDDSYFEVNDQNDSLADNFQKSSTESAPESRDNSQSSQMLSQSYFDLDQSSYGKGSTTISDSYFETLMQDSVGLREHLEWQIQMSSLSIGDMEIAYYVIENIDDAGFLTVNPEEIAVQIQEDFMHEVEADEIVAVIHQVQQLEPFGCASKDLQEFLIIQLNSMKREAASQQNPNISLAVKLVTHHFHALQKHQYQDLIQRLSLTELEMNDALNLIKNLRTQPNYQFIGESTEYIKPDVLVYKLGNEWQAQLAGHSTPHLDINHQYADSLRKSRNPTDHQYLRDRLQSARWFMQSIQARNDTLKRVADWIVHYQQNFFDNGESSIRPMRLKDLAQDLDLHESTISRACSDKYLQSPKGIYELKYFFSNAIPSTQGGEWSSKAIKNKIKQYVNAEPSRKPLSDIKLAELLNQEGVSIARRTVAKYREALNIPPACQRKLFTNS